MNTSLQNQEMFSMLKILKRVGLLFIMMTLTLTLSSCMSKAVPNKTQETRVLKKKIIMTGFAIPFPVQVSDVQDISQGLPREILNRLEKSGNFLIRQSPNLLSYDFKQGTPDARLVKQVAAENDAQFVISGEVSNAGVQSDKKYWGLWETRKRQIEIEFTIYDGASGVFLSKHHIYRNAEDDSKIGMEKPFGSAVFFATPYGKAIDAVIEESVGWIRRDLSFYPMMAKIIKVTDQNITLDVGVTSNVWVGDKALVVVNEDQLPINGLTSSQSITVKYGMAQASLGNVSITQSQLNFSVGKVDAEKRQDQYALKVGDSVRFDVK
jgi:hypothetical protein